MIVRVKFSDVKDRYLVNIKDNTQMYMRVEVDESNIEDAIEIMRNNKYCVGVDYIGDINALNDIDTKGVKVIVHVNAVDGLNTDEVKKICNSVNKDITVAVKLAQSFNDMKTVYELAEELKNVSFCGGHLLRLKGVKIGCVQPADTHNKFDFKRYTTEGECACVCKAVMFNEEDMQFRNTPLYENENKVSKVSKKSSNVHKTEKKSKVMIKNMFSTGDAFEGF